MKWKQTTEDGLKNIIKELDDVERYTIIDKFIKSKGQRRYLAEENTASRLQGARLISIKSLSRDRRGAFKM